MSLRLFSRYILARPSILTPPPGTSISQSALKSTKPLIDRSRVPVLNEEDLEEQFVKGTGPGGQSVNKSVNCVVLCHMPTGVIVRCHESRLQHQNREMARKLLVDKLDELFNGSLSVKGQKDAIDKKRKLKMEQKNRKLREKKLARKNSGEIEDESEDEHEYVDALQKNRIHKKENVSSKEE